MQNFDHSTTLSFSRHIASAKRFCLLVHIFSGKHEVIEFLLRYWCELVPEMLNIADHMPVFNRETTRVNALIPSFAPSPLK